jgi:hypothetical protein
MLRRSTVRILATALAAASALAACGSANKPSAARGPSTSSAAASKPATPSTAPPTSNRATTTTVAAPTMRYAKAAMAEAAEYALDAWCSPLEQASGHSLFTLKMVDVPKDIQGLSSVSTYAMMQTMAAAQPSQVSAHPVEQTILTGLVTAVAIVPVSVSSPLPGALTLHTSYCEAAPQPLTGYQMTANGGDEPVDMEVAYSLTYGKHVTWWHLWWQPTLQFTPCGETVCLNNWTANTTGFPYWAVNERSTQPEFVVPGPDGSWQLSYPPS